MLELVATKVLPAGGFIWSPDEDTRLQVTFPQPKLARRVGAVGGAGWWVYAAGEFGGGTWAYRTPAGAANVLALPGTTLVSTACPRTADLLRGLNRPVVTLDVSELHKAEAGLTCMSLVFGAETRRAT